jgi:multidrug efflux pump subunit AcrA (membrane-fusion protein)
MAAPPPARWDELTEVEPPTLITAVLVEENVLVKKDQPLFQFDRRPYEYKVEQGATRRSQAKRHYPQGGRGNRHSMNRQ